MADVHDDWISPAPTATGHDDWVTPSAAKPQAAAEPQGGILRNFGSNFVGGLTSIPQQLAAMGNADDPFLRASNPISEETREAGRDAMTKRINQAVGTTGLPTPENTIATTPLEKVSGMAGAGATALLFPELGAERAAGEVAASMAPRLAPARFANAPLQTLARRAVTGTAAGAGAGAAGEAVPKDMPATKLVTEAAAGILTGGATELPGVVKGLVAPAARRFAQPMTELGRDQLAADTLRQRSSAPAGLLETLDQPGHELVPGSKGTTGQITGDLGLLSLEREQGLKNPPDFNERRAEQNTARRQALTGVQSEGDPAAVSSFLQSHFRQIDDQAQAHVDDLTTQAQERASNTGGQWTPDQHGAGIRDALQQAENAARTKERSLWKAVDPDNSIRIDASPTFQAARDIQGGMSRMAAPMEGPEKGIFDSIAGDKQLSLGELSDLRSRVSTTARNELMTSGNSPAYARMIRLRGAIQNNLADAAAGKVSEDAQAVTAGQMAPEDTLFSKMQGVANEWKANRAAQARGEASPSAGGYSPSGQAGAGVLNGTDLPASGGHGSPAGDQGLPQAESVEPRPLNEEDASRLSEATKATRERAGTYGRGPIGQTLAKAGTQDVYKLPEAKVPDKFFHSGPTSASDIRGLRETIGADKADTLLSDFAASSLRRAAENPDGTLDPAKTAAWRRRFSGAMTEFPQMDEKFSNASSATQAIADATRSQRAAYIERNASALGKVVKADNPEDVTKVVGGLLQGKNGRQALGDLSRAVSANPEAKQGLRQAVADHISNNFISNTEAGTSGDALIKSDVFQTFLRKNRGALSQVFEPEEMKTLDAIAADLQRANRSITAAKLPGGSNTAQDLLGAVKNDPNMTVMDRTLAEAGAAVGGAALAHGAKGSVLGWAGAKVANALRGAGLEKVDEIVTEALLNPVFAKNLLRRAPMRPNDPIMQPVTARLRRIGLGTAAALYGGQNAPSTSQ